MNQKPSNAFVAASWVALFAGMISFCTGLWNADMQLNEKGYYFTVLMYGLFSAVSLQKAVRDQLEGVKVTNIYYGICWFSLILSLLLLVIGLWNATLLRSEKGFYGMAFTLSLFAAVAVQKNIRDIHLAERSQQDKATEWKRETAQNIRALPWFVYLLNFVSPVNNSRFPVAQLLFERKIKYQTELSATEVESRLRALISGDDKQTRDLQGKISPGEFLLYRAQQANFKFSLLLKGKVKVEGSILVVEVTYTIEKKLRRKIYLTFCLLVAILVVFKWQGLHLSPSIKYDELFALSGSVFVLGLMFSLFERETGCFSVLLSRQLELQEMKLPE